MTAWVHSIGEFLSSNELRVLCLKICLWTNPVIFQVKMCTLEALRKFKDLSDRHMNLRLFMLKSHIYLHSKNNKKQVTYFYLFLRESPQTVSFLRNWLVSLHTPHFSLNDMRLWGCAWRVPGSSSWSRKGRQGPCGGLPPLTGEIDVPHGCSMCIQGQGLLAGPMSGLLTSGLTQCPRKM